MTGLIGHNNPPADDDETIDNGTSVKQLKSYIERIQNVENDQADLAADKREIYAEAKANGFDVKTLRKVISEAKKDAETRQEERHMLEMYCEAIGLV